MIRLFVGAVALVCCLPSMVTEATAAGQRSLPMHFAWQREAPSTGCGTQCRTWISAVGTITADTPDAFRAFAETSNVRNATLVLDSGGGSVHGAIALGREIRRQNMTTMVGRTTLVPDDNKTLTIPATLSPRADCESMCAFVLLAGVKRIVPSQARVMVHQIWLGDRRDDAAAATYSADDLVLVQRDIGRLVRYVAEMAASSDFLELSLRIPPWEPMHVMTRAELQTMHVETEPEPPSAKPEVVAAVPSESAPATIGSHPGSEVARGWAIVEQSGRPALTRRHPLTVEGIEIGSFDLTLACGDTPDAFAISYNERRQAQGGLMTPLKTVALELGRRMEELKIVSSQSGPQSPELNSVARGSIPSKQIQWLSSLGSHAILVSTANADDARTSIRVGNSGLGMAFAKLKQSCSQHSASVGPEKLAPPAVPAVMHPMPQSLTAHPVAAHPVAAHPVASKIASQLAAEAGR